MNKNEDEAYSLLGDMTVNNYLWPSERVQPPMKVSGIHEVDAIAKLIAQVALLTQQMQKNRMRVNAVQAQPPLSCDFCNGAHHSLECQVGNPFPPTIEQEQFVGNFNRQQNNSYAPHYNLGSRNHLNFSWKNNQQAPPPEQGKIPPEKKIDLEKVMYHELASSQIQLA